MKHDKFTEFKKATFRECDEKYIQDMMADGDYYGIFECGADFGYKYRQAEIDKLKAALDVMRRVIEENTCYDDCGFDPVAEDKETLVSCFKNNDEVGRQALDKADEILKGSEGWNI